METKKKYNAKENNTRGEQTQDNSNSHPNDKSTAKTNIASFRDEPKRTNRTLGKGSSSAFSKTIVGGILNRLRSLQKMHMEYVDAHGERLEKRLAENHQHKSQVFQEMHYLETELVHLLNSDDEDSSGIEEE